MHLRIMTLAFVLMWARPAPAQCPGTTHYTTSSPPSAYFAAVYSQNRHSPGPLFDFIGAGCTAVPVGPNPPISCLAARFVTSSYGSLTYTGQLTASFLSGAANVTANGCLFNCGGGSCLVRGGDGLPVELMSFSVGEEEESSDR